MKNVTKRFTINIVSTLPPNGGVSDYTDALLRILQESVSTINFFGFSSLYPKFLAAPAKSGVSEGEYSEHVKISRPLSWWNPLAAILIPFRMSGKYLNLQYWSPATVHVYLTILIMAKILGKHVLLTVHNPSQHEKVWVLFRLGRNPEDFILNILVSKLINFLIGLIIRLSNEYVVHTESSKKALSELYPSIHKKRISVIEHPVLAPYPKTGITKVDARASLELPHNKTILLFFGNVRIYKGIEDVLRLWSGLDPDQYHLLITGRVWNSRIHTILNKAFDGRSNYTLIADFIPAKDIEKIFVASDLLLLAHRDFSSASGILKLAINYNIPTIGSESFRNILGIDTVVNDITSVSSKTLRETIDHALDKSTIVDTIHSDITQKYTDLFNSYTNS